MPEFELTKVQAQAGHSTGCRGGSVRLNSLEPCPEWILQVMPRAGLFAASLDKLDRASASPAMNAVSASCRISHTGAGFRDAVVTAQVDLLVFDRRPNPFDTNIVPLPKLTILAQLFARDSQHFDELDGCGVAVLVRVHDLKPTVVSHGVIECFDARPGFEPIGQPPGQDILAEPIEQRDYTYALCHTDQFNCSLNQRL